MRKYIISVWNSVATLFIMNETDETLEYNKIDIPSNIAQSVQEYIDSQVDLSKSLIYPLSSETLEKLKELGLDL